jgi:ribosome-binding ATPase
MNLSIGIVGLPNVGKSTLFNALLKKQQAFVANYPFATVEPNLGVVPVKDSRLDELAAIEKRENKMLQVLPIIPATVSFVDIAGLVKGAATGEGLGNKFLSHVRECNAICQVIRYFTDTEITHVSGLTDPQSDFEVVNTELILADLQTIQNSKGKTQKAKVQVKGQNEALEKLEKGLNEGKLAKDVDLTDEEKIEVQSLQLLTMKPMFIVANVDENQLNQNFPANTIPVCAKIEEELSLLSEDEQKDYLETLGLKESGLERIIKKGYGILNLISFLTAGEKEVRAWTIKKGSTALLASGVIHTDFMKKFIKAEVVAFDDFVNCGGRKKARELGKARLEGKEYIVKDGDVVEFKIGA